MKKLKKLLAVVLACAMALSLCATALASEDDGSTLVTSFEDDEGNPPGGNIDAQSITQGGLPAKPISIILPVVTERDELQEGQSQLFDFYLDPHQLITKTEAAKYADSEVSFAPDTRLYFAADGNKSEYTYDRSSQSLTVTNTGFVDLNVDLDLEFDRGGAEFDLVSSPSAFSENAAGDVPAQMYLAVVGGGQTKAVLDPSVLPTLVIDTTEDATSFLNTTAPTFMYPSGNALNGVNGLAPTLLNSVLTGTSGYALVLTATEDIEKANAFYKAQKEELETALKDAELTLTYAAADSDAGTTASITVALATLPTGCTTVVKQGNDTKTDGKIDGSGTITVEIQVVDDRETPDDDTDDVTLTLAKLTFGVAFPGASSSVADGDTQTIKFNVPHTGAKIETALGVLEDSYKLSCISDDSEREELEDKNIEVTDNGYYWKQSEEDTTLYPAFSFHLVGDINEALNTDDDTSPWDDITNGDSESDHEGITAIGFTMIWDITPYDKTQGRTKLTTPAGAEDESNDVLPTVTVTKAATGTGSTTKTATLTWTAGMGAYEACVPTAAKSGNASATSIALNSTGSNTFTLVATTTNKNSKCFVTFSDGTNSVDVEVNGWYTGT